MTNATDIEIRRYTHTHLPLIRQTLLDLHSSAYAQELDDEFNQRFPWFVDHWGSHPGFSCVIGHSGGGPVGFAYGAPATEGREWWREHVVPAPAKARTYSFSELAVHPAWRKTGAAALLSKALLETREEDLAVLLVDTRHPKVQALYESWGYRKVGERQPFPDSPLFAVMFTELPLR
ncbi:GNAT family N-acetyltransferase [Streptomyces niveus]|uniref:GNAT family N-acetyltransferase n=1 Tax=Streptomyces niveus TaxID=193462 RepID=UPI00084BCF74|nr:GNAT family N-acetyltransferase [Streptomyces niveus]